MSAPKTRVILLRETLAQSLIRDAISLSLLAGACLLGWWVGSAALQWIAGIFWVLMTLSRVNSLAEGNDVYGYDAARARIDEWEAADGAAK